MNVTTVRYAKYNMLYGDDSPKHETRIVLVTSVSIGRSTKTSFQVYDVCSNGTTVMEHDESFGTETGAIARFDEYVDKFYIEPPIPSTM